MKRIFVTRRLPEPVEARLARSFDVTVNVDDRPLSPAEVATACGGMDALVINTTERLDAAAVSDLPESLKAVATYSVGHEHLDLEALQARGIPVVYTPDVLSASVADNAMLLMLGAARRAREGQALIVEGRWKGWGPRQLIGTEVTGKRLGIFGMGRIGREIARRARAFDMEVGYRNRRPLEAGAGLYFADEREFLSRSDILVIAAPASPETRRWLNAERIAGLPEGALVVNIARGSLVDDDALTVAVESGRLAGAGLDVFEGEPDIHPAYLRLDRIYVQPHIGSSTMETRLAMAEHAISGLEDLFAGRSPSNRLV